MMDSSSSYENGFERYFCPTLLSLFLLPHILTFSLFNVLGPFDLFSPTSTSITSNTTPTNDPMSRSRRELVVKICLLVDNPSDLHVSVAAMEALLALGDSPQYSPTSSSQSSPNYSNNGEPHKLFSLLENSGILPSVMETFLRRLEREEVEKGTKPSPDDIESFGLANVIRLQIVDFLTRNISKGYYTLAHYLLGLPGPFEGRFTADLQLEKTKNGGPSNCLHMILELLSFGISGGDGYSTTSTSRTPPLICLDHPMLAARLYELVQTIVEVPYLQKGALSLLREGSFISYQIQNISPDPFDEDDSCFTAFQLLQKASLYRIASLDLYDSTLYGNVKYSISLLEDILAIVPKDIKALFLISTPQTSNTSTLPSSFTSLEGSISKLLELIFSLPLPTYDKEKFTQTTRSLYLGIAPILTKTFLNSSTEEGDEEEDARTLFSLSNISNLLFSMGNFYISNRKGSGFDCEEGRLLFLATIEWSLITCGNKSDLITRTLCYSLLTIGLQNGIPLKEDLASSCVGGNVMFDNLVGDLLIPLEQGLAPWKSVVCVFLCTILKEIPSISERVFSSGLVRNLVLSLRGDDRFVESAGGVDDVDGCLFLWKSKMSIFQLLPAGKLFDCALLDVLSSLNILTDISSSDLERQKMVWTPLMMLISTMSFGNGSSSSSSSFSIDGPIPFNGDDDNDDEQSSTKLNEAICLLMKEWKILEKLNHFPMKFLLSTLINCISSYGAKDPFRGICRREVLRFLEEKKELSLCITFWLGEIKFYPFAGSVEDNDDVSIWTIKKDPSYDLQYPSLPIKVLIDVLEGKCGTFDEESERVMDLIYEVVNRRGGLTNDDYETERLSQILHEYHTSTTTTTTVGQHPLVALIKK